MAVFQPSAWHEGEDAIHRRTHVDFRDDNPTTPFLTPRAAVQIQRYPLMALGTLDDEDRPWCTVWGSGEPPLAQAVAQSVIGIRSQVDASFDPVVQAIWRGRDDGEVLREEGEGRLWSGLSIQLEERGRVKLAGRIIAGALSADAPGTKGDDRSGKAGQVQLAVKIDQSLGNCPKYLNKKAIASATPQPKLLSSSPHLDPRAVDLIHKADMFFIASAHAHEDMDCNHRGGPQSFIRVEQPADPQERSVVVWPEYSGNNLYQTLGNLETTPRAGLAIPDFETGDVVYLTGDTETLVGPAASTVLAKSTLAVRLRVTAARLVQAGLPFRGSMTDDATRGRSPYNPRVRYLASEQADAFGKGTRDESAPTTAQLVHKTRLTPTVSRYRFALSDPATFGPWRPGQYVALDVAAELDMGYSHMRDDDPTSLNDDFIRTFTVSSIPNSLGEHGEEFEITVRNVGRVTQWLEWQRPGRCEVCVRGFGGEFAFEPTGKATCFVAAGIGITPLLGQIGDVDLATLKVWWSVGVKDVGLPLAILAQFPQLREVMTIYLTGDANRLANPEKQQLAELVNIGVHVERRRLTRADLTGTDTAVENWYLCTAPAMRKMVQEWMPGTTIVYENFDY